MSHWFHFILDRKTVLRLIAAGNLRGFREVGRFIVTIFARFCWLIEYHHLTGPDQKCRYTLISEDLEDKRQRIWLPFPEKIYQRLKSIHKDKNYYSIAQCVRFVIHEYLLMRETLSHAELIAKLDKIRACWVKARGKFRPRPMQIYHMLKYGGSSTSKLTPYMVFYSDEAAPDIIWSC